MVQTALVPNFRVRNVWRAQECKPIMGGLDSGVQRAPGRGSKRIRGYFFYNEMRYINLRFTYLLTYKAAKCKPPEAESILKCRG